MIIQDTVLYGDGRIETVEIEVADNYFDPPKEIEAQPTQLDIIEAQVTYTAMMTDTLLGG